jgi:hypothetical protein
MRFELSLRWRGSSSGAAEDPHLSRHGVRTDLEHDRSSSTFGNQIIGNYDTQIQTGNAFIYNIKTGASDQHFPGAITTTAYGIWANKIAGGYTALGPGGGLGLERGYIYDQSTGVWTNYNHPGAVFTHFEGITSGGRAGEFNLAADWVDALGQSHASALHIDSSCRETWLDVDIPGATLVSANSVYQDKVVGIYADQVDAQRLR